MARLFVPTLGHGGNRIRLWLPDVFSEDRAGFASHPHPVSVDERGCAFRRRQLARMCLSLENLAASALELQAGGSGPWLPEARGLSIAPGDGTVRCPGDDGGAVVGANWTSSRPPRTPSRSAMFCRPGPSGMWRRLTWQQLPKPRLGQHDLKERTRDGRPPMLLRVCPMVFDCCQECCHGGSQLSTEDDRPGTSAQYVISAGRFRTVRP